MSGFAGIIAYEPEELILEAGAGTPLSEVEALIAARGQQLAFEPPDWSALLGSAHSGTLGGLVACNLSGPRRIKAGAVRDHMLGLRGVTGAGVVFKAGARVVKNVTGYDLPKLLDRLLRHAGRPDLGDPQGAARARDRGDGGADRARRRGGRRRHEPRHAIALRGLRRGLVPGEAVYLRLEGIAPSVAYRRDQLAKLLERPVEILAAKSSAARWRAIRDGALFADRPSHPLWRLSVTPSDAPRDHPRAAGQARHPLSLSTGRAGSSGSRCRPRRMRRRRWCGRRFSQGHATLLRAPDAVRAAVDVFQPQAAAACRAVGARQGILRPAPHPQSRPHVSGHLMQTSFTAEQLATPRIAEANTILRKCVHCGFCTATCPTYVLLGDELDSARAAASTSSRTCWRAASPPRKRR